ncbi:MAG: insulinase family protein [Thaumarchaeota archaeon]|nr:insulinase family protein [Nitrososphaerota archaeon]
MLSTILGGGMSSRLFTEVREKRGLAYSISSDIQHFVDTGYFECQAGLDKTRIDEALKVILYEFYELSVKSARVTEKELTKAKEYIKGHFALGLESTRAVNAFFGIEEILLKKTRTPEEVYKNIDKITEKDVLRVAKGLFKPSKLNLAIIGPFEDASRFEKIIKAN